MSDARQQAASSLPMVHVVEDDPDLREALEGLLSSVSVPHQMYESAEQFRRTLPLPACGCLVLDIRLPGSSGVELAGEIRRSGVSMPIIMMSAHADVPVTIESFKLGAFDFLIKPFASGQFVETVRKALIKEEERLRTDAQLRARQSRLSKLTTRDWDVIDLLRRGFPNKRIAVSLDITERAVEMRRAALLEKTQTSGLPELFELVGQCQSGGKAPAK